MLTWRHNISIHTIAHHSGGKDEVQLRTISHLPLWCQSRQFVPVRLFRFHGALGRHAARNADKAGTTAWNGKWWPWL